MYATDRGAMGGSVALPLIWPLLETGQWVRVFCDFQPFECTYFIQEELTLNTGIFK